MVHPHQLFHLPLSIEAIRQLHDLQQLLDQVHFHLLRINGDILGLEYFFHWERLIRTSLVSQKKELHLDTHKFTLFTFGYSCQHKQGPLQHH